VIADPEAFDLVRQAEGGPLARAELLAEASAELAAAADERSAVAALRRFRDRHTLRIALGEFAGRQKHELVTEQVTWRTESLVEAALQAAQRKASEDSGASGRRTVPSTSLSVVALGRLGAAEMDYDNRLELLLVHEPAPAATEAARRAADEQAERVARQFLRYVSGPEAPLYHVDHVALPDSTSPVLVHTADDTVLGFDSFGRTWHRQAMLRARPIAGDRDLAAAVLQRLQPWIFRRYLNRADETGIKALRRRILKRTGAADDDPQDARGGLADIEAVVQYLQLLCGGDRPAARERGTLAAIAGLELAGVLSAEERTLLESNYLRLRQALHWRQVRGDDSESASANPG
jgi:glutamate-ammonia-ligase adenylyltransferase